MSRQIEMEFSYAENDDVSEPIFPQDLLVEIIETRVSYAASLNLDNGVTAESSRIQARSNSINTKI